MDRTYVFTVKLDRDTAQRVQTIAEAGKQAPNDILQIALDSGLRFLEREMNERAQARRGKRFVEVLGGE